MDFNKTTFRRLEQYQDRWSSYGGDTGISQFSEKLRARDLRRFEIFQDYDDKFLEQISPDVSVATWRGGSVLFEEGSYIDLAFYVARGEVVVYLSKLHGEEAAAGPIFHATQTMAAAPPTVRGRPNYASSVHGAQSQAAATSKTLTFLSTMDVNLPRDGALKLGPGEFFGEIGALNGWPQSVTAIAKTQSSLVQIRVPALRLMRRKSKAFKKRIDDLYRSRSLFQQLKASPLFQGCRDDFIAQLAAKVELVSKDPNEIVTEEGNPADGLYLIRSGHVKLTKRSGKGQIVGSYLSKGMTFGGVELLVDGIDDWQFSATSVGYSEFVSISRDDFNRIMRTYPDIEKLLWQHAVAQIKETGYHERHPEESEFVQFSLDKGLVEGNSILVIDLNDCTRCDECVRACADTHDGRPRFTREGDKYDNLLITKACYHCEDPVCLIGCPTGAIHRANVGDVVEIQDSICIGCATCANNCPYDAIMMHNTQTRWPDDALPKLLRGKTRMLASKCDLCYTSSTGPACVRECPQGCAYRVGTLDEFRQLMTKD